MEYRQARLIDVDRAIEEIDKLFNDLKGQNHPSKYRMGYNDGLMAALDVLQDAETLGTELVPDEGSDEYDCEYWQ